MEVLGLFALFAALLVLRQSVILILLAATAYVHFGWGDGLIEYLIEDLWTAMDNSVLLAIPMFIIAGALMSRGSIAQRLIDIVRAATEWMPGGLGFATILSCALFAAISGSSPATLLAVGAVMYPALKDAGYSKSFALGAVTSAGTLGIIIPPSIPLIIYGIITETSIVDLFLAGIIPGILLTLSLGFYSIWKNRHVPRTPFSAIRLLRAIRTGIYTHSHTDHFGGVRGVVDSADVDAGRVPIIAPDGFMEYAISENVLAGNAMNRRAQYQFGFKLTPGPTGHVDCGLGKVISNGTVSLIPPTDIVRKTGETRVIDGVTIEFQMANGSEAPSEFMFYFPQFKALCASEVMTHNMHNILTPRGAECRNTLGWSKYIDESIAIFGGRADLIFASHHWPTWGTERINSFLIRQRDLYRFIHDETLRLANHGHTLHEIPDMIEMPEGLRHDFACRGYYGTLKHNIKAVYQFYLGWWGGNPATYDALSPTESGKRLVRAMGGAAAVLAEGRRAYDEGDYRWAAELINKLVFAEPDNTEATGLQAEILEQMGYQAEAGTWRNIFLFGAQVLRGGVDAGVTVNTSNTDVLFNMGIPMALDFLGVKFNAEKTDGDFRILLDFTDKGESHLLAAQNGVLANTTYHDGKADLTLRLTEVAFFKMIGKIATVEDLAGEGVLSLDGDASKLADLFGAMDDFDPNFAIVTP